MQREVELKLQRDFLGIEPTSERAERLASLLTLSYEPMLAWRLDGPIQFWNTGAEQLYGFAPQEAVGRESHALLHTKFPIEFDELRSQLRSRRYWSGELRHICKDGHEVTVDSRMQLFGDDTVLEVNRDVTEVKALITGEAALERELAATAAKFEALFNQTGIFAGIMDLQGYLREANNLALDACGYTREQVLDRPFWDTPWWRGSEQIGCCHRQRAQCASIIGLGVIGSARPWIASTRPLMSHGAPGFTGLGLVTWNTTTALKSAPARACSRT